MRKRLPENDRGMPSLILAIVVAALVARIAFDAASDWPL
ncbi:hypothetical protein LKMONMHP_1656 [Methylobacterium organophilum]|uniref:Uncharacterized protein n=1 Tax=Methylobacterium organophilum TaxID=410 RepID=A0ABQ4T762_METOR|nr:hypothetical protein LKMONMHP_1656 [Methylobacterium organophilum]